MPSNGKNRRKRNPRHKKDFQDRAATFTSEDVISKSELEGEDVLSLPELRTKSITEIQSTAEDMGIENISRARRQDITFSILKAHAAEDKRNLGRVFSRFFRMDLASSDLPTHHISLDQMMYMYLQHR